ncbi:hypothetical protein PZ938_01915 [Luteipulveratus sp. YIM 133132]|uniref:Uncharacterized protein n=1 Tax=Luteipulveratus flavus TaxID=3031728 RepID=A0ABT6CC02_9MICO|nr:MULTISPECIES: hypothetical protein [unclassified Luteipulveratus]MDE9364349.1 hypothetical protein [Luteipulveratus sp. YIM 133132]MDF8266437.1 hypothetical protein [Luteipulveratus sp. YIM 133296]
MIESAAVAGRFADEFAPWAVTLPARAVEERRDGCLFARGWSVRWRWHTDSTLELRASHRMTSERWWVLQPDGTKHRKHVPAAMMAYMPGDDVAALRADYRASWRKHEEAVQEAGMAFADAPRGSNPDESTMVWRCDGETWQTDELAPRPPA